MKDVKMTIARLALIVTLLFPVIAFSEDAPTPTPTPVVLAVEGVSGDVDKHHRSPTITASSNITADGVSILADTSELNSEYTKYPIRMDFYINRKLYSSQIRSPELPGALGVFVPKSIASVPFNYTIVATLLHPNHLYTSVMQAAVMNNE